MPFNCCGEKTREERDGEKHILLECPKHNKEGQEYIWEENYKSSRSILSHPTNERWGNSWCFQRKTIQVLILGGEVDGRRLQFWLPSEDGR